MHLSKIDLDHQTFFVRKEPQNELQNGHEKPIYIGASGLTYER